MVKHLTTSQLKKGDRIAGRVQKTLSFAFCMCSVQMLTAIEIYQICQMHAMADASDTYLAQILISTLYEGGTGLDTETIRPDSSSV